MKNNLWNPHYNATWAFTIISHMFMDKETETQRGYFVQIQGSNWLRFDPTRFPLEFVFLISMLCCLSAVYHCFRKYDYRRK